MIPRDVYEHVRFGSGARPGAALTRAGKTYNLYPSLDGQGVTCVRHDPSPKYQGQAISLSKVPDSLAEEWDQYWTHEC